METKTQLLAASLGACPFCDFYVVILSTFMLSNAYAFMDFLFNLLRIPFLWQPKREKKRDKFCGVMRWSLTCVLNIKICIICTNMRFEIYVENTWSFTRRGTFGHPPITGHFGLLSAIFPFWWQFKVLLTISESFIWAISNSLGPFWLLWSCKKKTRISKNIHTALKYN